MKLRHLATAILVVLFPACGNSAHGTEMVRETRLGKATMYHTPAVDPALAAKVFEAMLACDYNFASNLPEQVDRVDGRLTVRLCNDNEDSLHALATDPSASGIPSYVHGLAHQISKAIDGEPVDVVMCRQTLAEPILTIAWDPNR